MTKFLHDMLGLLAIATIATIGFVVAAHFVRRHQLRIQRDLWKRFGLRPDPPEPEVTVVVMVKMLIAMILAGAKGMTAWVGTHRGFAPQLINGACARM